MTLTGAEVALVDRWQRNFPLVPQPFVVVGETAGLNEAATIAAFAHLRDTEVLSRIGAVVRPNTVGASMLAAMRVPADRIDDIAAIVSAEPLVTHNYEREHAINLWFVVAGPDAASLAETLARIEKRGGISIIRLPLVEAYYLDLGFTLTRELNASRACTRTVHCTPNRRDQRLLAAIEDGLPLVARPYREVGRKIDLTEDEVIDQLCELLEQGVVSRFGCVVRHRLLGFSANAMAVWDVPDDVVDAVARRCVSSPHVTLCYQRPRRLPDWPYNLFCMVHARTRPEALAAIDDLNAIAQASHFEQAVLFSTRCFKQRGAVFSDHRRDH
jgi:siroheme decarboxylase